jgi:photosystem II stability/assembly factor-like uncharacterized protein
MNYYRNFLYCFILFLLFSVSGIFSQENEEGDSISYKRDSWFFHQRSYPYDSIQHNAYINAVNEMEEIKNQGSFLNTPTGWVNIGPKSEGGPGINYDYTGRVKTVLFDDTGNLYCGAATGGFWKKNATSDTWEFKSGNMKSLSSGAIAIDNTTNPPTIYYATGEGAYSFVYIYAGIGIYKSTDGGENWTLIGTNTFGLKNFFFSRLAIDPYDHLHLLAATNNGLYSSSDGGNNWERIIPQNEDAVCTDVVFSKYNHNVYAVGPISSHPLHGIGYYKSTNSGQTFTQINLSYFPNGRSHIDVLSDPQGIIDDKVYAVTHVNNAEVHIFVSTNGGQSFNNPGFNLLDNGLQPASNLFIRVNPNNPNLVFVGLQALYKSTNGGYNYCKFSGPGELINCQPSDIWMHFDHHNMDFHPSNPNEMVVCNDGGIFRSTDGGINWLNLSKGLSVNQCFRIDANHSDFITGGMEDNRIMMRQGETYWVVSSAGAGDGTTIAYSRVNENFVLGVSGNGGDIFKSTNFGIRFLDNSVAFPYLTTIWDGNNDWMGPMASHPINGGFFFVPRRANIPQNNNPVKLYYSSDEGTTWNSSGTLPSTSENQPPQDIAISNPNSNIMYIITGGYPPPIISGKLFKSTDGGNTWSDKRLDLAGIPDRYITHVITARADNISNEDEVFITLSGYGSGHVYKSSDGGNNWSDISGNLPDIPVNDIVVRYTGPTSEEYIVATDNGVLISTDYGTSWKNLADNLPYVVCMDLNYNPFTNKLRVASFGRSIWEAELPGEIFIRDYEVSPSTTNIIINKNINICNGGTLVLPENDISVLSGIKIKVDDGGKLIGNPNFILTSNTGWQGIEINGNGICNLNGCRFWLTDGHNAITITGNGSLTYDLISITNCKFESGTGPIVINGRNNIYISNNEWNYSGTTNIPEVCGISSTGSNNIDLKANKINTSPSPDLNSTGISVTFGNDNTIEYNEIYNTSVGINVDNSNCYLYKNIVTNTNSSGAVCGISMDNAYSAVLNQNTVNGYNTGIYLYNSSPVMFTNTVVNGEISEYSLNADYQSYPRLHPTFTGSGTILDGGMNTIHSLISGSGILLSSSEPDLDFGYNNVDGFQYYMASYDPPGGVITDYYLRCNTWGSSPPDPNKFNIANRNPVYSCDIGGGPHPPLDSKSPVFLSEDPDPPEPIIVNYGNGVYDTVQVSVYVLPVPADQVLYSNAIHNELTGNYSTAFSQYEQIIQNYHDSLTAKNSLRRLLQCRDRVAYDSVNYNNLRSYYTNLSGQYQNDTTFKQITDELAAKCLVRLKNFPGAITEYEGIINRTLDSGEVLCSELNIIETYMIMQTSGMAKSFTGQKSNLKPKDLKDGYRMIMEKLHKSYKNPKIKNIPISFSLSQNYPNPFNPITKINYALPKKSNVTIKVFDILGRLVKTLVNETKDAGYYTITFDGTGLSSGIYFYTIEAGSFRDSKKMVLVK